MALQRRTAAKMRFVIDGVAVVMLAAPLILILLWWGSNAQGGWLATNGTLLEATAALTHYNAIDHYTKVAATYEYEVGSDTYQGHWAGLWPETKSPNALPLSRVRELEPGYPLTVLYDPSDPARSSLHHTTGRRLLYALLFPVSLILAAVYIVKIYPALRRVL